MSKLKLFCIALVHSLHVIVYMMAEGEASSMLQSSVKLSCTVFEHSTYRFIYSWRVAMNGSIKITVNYLFNHLVNTSEEKD